MAYSRKTKSPPLGNELKAPLGELIVAGCGLMTPRDLNALVVGSESNLVVDESPEAVAAV